MTKPKGFAKHKNGKAHPIFEKNGITESNLPVILKGKNDTIEVVRALQTPRRMIVDSNSEERKIIHEMAKLWNDKYKHGKSITKDEMRLELFRKGFKVKDINYALKNARTKIGNDDLDFTRGLWEGDPHIQSTFNIYHPIDDKWDKMNQSEQREWNKAIGFYDNYVGVSWKHIPTTVQHRIRGDDIGENIEKRWLNLNDSMKKTIINETYHGGMSDALVKELASNLHWEKLPELNRREIKAYLNYGSRY